MSLREFLKDINFEDIKRDGILKWQTFSGTRLNIPYILDTSNENSMMSYLIRQERYEDCDWLTTHCKENGIILNK